MKITKQLVYTLIVVLFIAVFAYFYYIGPSIAIVKGSGTVLSPNWWEGLNWIKENTDECAVIATYWDPGHFITGISRRPVVFDGASQSELYTRPADKQAEDGLYTEQLDSGINHIVLYKNGNKTTARIQDISTTLLTSNETLAMEILKDYRKPGCNEMYYIASADLIGKSVWWSYFATWDPVDKGKQYSYVIGGLSKAQPILNQNAIAFVYPFGQDQTFIVYDQNGTLQAYLQVSNQQPVKVRNIFYFDQAGQGILREYQDAKLEGTVWLTSDRQTIVFMPPELQNSMFTRLFFLNGAGLEHFEFVNSWGGELKLFRVVFDDDTENFSSI